MAILGDVIFFPVQTYFGLACVHDTEGFKDLFEAIILIRFVLKYLYRIGIKEIEGFNFTTVIFGV